ncbi:MAG: hypothetical protein JRI25_12170 [Deltaproteobacteria bacterium]|nr:hypothetical protein [Deltaproteobacteria bacterium]
MSDDDDRYWECIYCGEWDENIDHWRDCRKHPAKAEVAALHLERDEARRQLAGLLAIIHRDGGHYQGQHGTQKAVLDAVDLVLAERDRDCEGASWPQGGHWTREPADVEGEYLHRSWGDKAPKVFRLLVSMRPCEFSDYIHDPAYRWSTPLPPMPPVPEVE